MKGQKKKKREGHAEERTEVQSYKEYTAGLSVIQNRC